MTRSDELRKEIKRIDNQWNDYTISERMAYSHIHVSFKAELKGREDMLREIREWILSQPSALGGYDIKTIVREVKIRDFDVRFGEQK